MDEKLGKIVVDGEIIDLDNTTSEKLEKCIEKLEKREQELNDEIDAILKD